MTDNFKNAQWSYENQEPEEEPPVVFDESGNQYVVSWSEFDGFTLKNIRTRDKDLVNVANMRHLWLIDNNTELGWKNSDNRRR